MKSMNNLLDKDINFDEYMPVIKKSKLISNYFYPNINKIQSEFNEKINNDDLYKRYGTPYIVCLKDKSKFDNFYYDEKITEEQLNEIIDSIEIISIKYKVLTGSLYKYLTLISAEIFNSNFTIYDKFNKKYVANNNILICSLLRFKYSNIIEYLKQFNGLCNFINIYNTYIINEYFGQFNDISTVRNNLILMINNMDETNYYVNYNNCLINITNNFQKRNFNNKIVNKLKNNNIINILNNINKNNIYSLDIQKSEYVDPSIVINNNGYNIYKIYNNVLYDILKNDNFNDLFCKFNEQEKYYMINNSLVSKDLCHYIINNKFILEHINNNMSRYAQIIRYTLGYTWITLYIEECIQKLYIKNTDRFIFKIETASLLPWFPYSISKLNICPYLPLLIDNELINANRNILGGEQIFVSSERYKELFRYGITKKDKFIERFNQFVSGKENINLFENINWENIAVCGSIMACCLPNFNTVMCNHFVNNNINFISFINEYYKDADIDIMCSISDIYEYIDKINEITEIIQNNIIKYYKLNDTFNIIDIYSNKSVSIIINKEFIQKHLLDVLNMNYYDIINNINNIKIKQEIYKHYIKWFKDNLEISLKNNYVKFLNAKYHQLYIPVDIDNINIIFINDKLDKNKSNNNNFIDNADKDFDKEKDFEEEDYIDEIFNNNTIVFSIKTNYKYRISSAYLPHSIEIFQVKNNNFFSTVGRFYLPIVRSYYDGNNVYITPSCISACMTLINIDYKYFSGSKDPIEIINKYRMRGFGTILNNIEIDKLIRYSYLVEKWKKIYNINNKRNNRGILGSFRIHKDYFNLSNIDFVQYNILTNNEICDIIKKIYNTKSNNLISNFITINKYGYIEPVRKWIIDASYELI